MKLHKIIFCALILCSFLEHVRAQDLLLEEGFENHLPDCYEFIDGCVPGWINTHGTANVYENGSGWLPGPSFNGERHAHVYVTKNTNCLPDFPADQGEGMALNFDFLPGEYYRITYALRGADVQEVTWFLTDGLQNNGGSPSPVCTNPASIVPPVPANSQELTPSVLGFYSLFDWEVFQTDWFTPDSEFGQLWFRCSNINSGSCIITGHMNLDDVIIERWTDDITCSDPITDLNACIEQGNFGSISFECEADYEWVFPAGSTAIEFTSDTHSTILQASPGIYTVTITNVQGLFEQHTFEIIEDCCDIVCTPPQTPFCESAQDGVHLNWDAVPGVNEYAVTINYNDGDCGCGNGSNVFTQNETVSGTEFVISGFFVPCFSWSVQAICDSKILSESSDVMCFDGSQDCFSIGNSFKSNRPDFHSNKSAEELDVNVYPNPATDRINIDLEIEKSTAISIRVFDTKGSLIAAFDEEGISPGLYHKTWSPKQKLSNGSYIIHIQTESGEVKKTLIIENN